MDRFPILVLAIALAVASPLAAQRDGAPPEGPMPHPEDRSTTAPLHSPGGPEGAAPSDELERSRQQERDRQQRERQAGAPPRLTSAEAQPMVGRSVVLPDGRAVGEVADFVLGGPDGRIAEAVIAQGGVMGVGARLVSVPATLLRFEPDSRTVVLEMAAAQFAAAPPFRYDPQIQTLLKPRTPGRG